MDSGFSEDVINQIKNFKHSYDVGFQLTKKESSIIDKLIQDEELKKRYKNYGLCKECNQPNTANTGNIIGVIWCHSCNSKHFQQDFRNWTSGNLEIDEFIQEYQ